jgi:thiol:disulfide interchange protein DsbA
MHAKTFDRFHRQRKPVDSLADMLQFAAESGLDVAKVKEAWNGFAVSTRLAQARRLCEAWGVDFVPQLGIQGRFLTAPSMAGDGTRALAAADTLIALVRKGA